MTHVSVIDGDITAVKSDGLITAISSSGMWFGGIDGAIKQIAGGAFHAEATKRRPLTDHEVIYAAKPKNLGCQFGDVIFVVDDLQRPLRDVVLAGLNEADSRGLALVSLPTLRTGVMADAFERTIDEVLDEMITAIKQFQASSPENVLQVQVVVYDDVACSDYLKSALN